MACYILNKTYAPISNLDVKENLFGCQNTTTDTTSSGCEMESSGANVLENEDVIFIWHVKNKYYKADIRVHVSKDFVSHNCRVPPIGAIVYYTDEIPSAVNNDVEYGDTDLNYNLEKWIKSHKQKHLHDLKSSSVDKPNIDLNEPSNGDDSDSEEVRLIVAGHFVEDDTKSATLKWALDKGVEVIDMSDKDEDGFDEKDEKGCKENNQREPIAAGKRRVLEALQTYPWHESDQFTQHATEKDQCQNEGTDANPVPAGGDFEELMSKLSTYKQTSDNLPTDERYAFAEQIALSFYTAMGGDGESDTD